MEDTNSVVVTDEKLTQEQIAAQEAAQKTEADAQAKADAEQSVYKQELAKITAEKDKAETIARQKEGALKEERLLRKAAEDAKIVAEEKASKVDLTVDEIDKRLEAKLAARDFTQALAQVSNDPDEQKLVKHHYETSIVKTGNVAADLQMAVAIANQHLINQAREAQAQREQGESKTAGFQGSGSYGRSGQPAYQTEPSLKAAGALLDKWGLGDAKKHLGK